MQATRSWLNDAENESAHVPPIRVDPEYRRILALPRRKEEESTQQDIIARTSSHVVASAGSTPSLMLRQLQYQCLTSFEQNTGLLGALGVGEGKTLVSALLGSSPACKRTLLLQPATLLEKTVRDFQELQRVGWIVPNVLWPRKRKDLEAFQWKDGEILCLSYEIIANVKNKGLLDRLLPDLILADEAHAMRNRSSVVTRTVHDFLAKRKVCRFVALSGSFIGSSLSEIAHLGAMALGSGSPYPYPLRTVNAWGNALDHHNGPRAGLGVLKTFGEDLDAARRGYAMWVRDTPGVVMSSSADALGTALNISVKGLPVPKDVAEIVKQVRNTWTLPGGHEFSEALEMHAHLHDLALGFYREPVDVGPPEWYAARREWLAHVKSRVTHGRAVHSAGQVRAEYLEMGVKAPAVFRAWEELKDTFTPQTRPVWVSDFVYDYAREWMAEDPHGLVWVQDGPLGERLDYFYQNAHNKAGVYAQDAEGSIALSVASCNRGLNMQYKWWRNLYLGAFASFFWWEQSLGRTHRAYQVNPEVTVEILANLPEVQKTVDEARERAVYVSHTTLTRPKLTLATWL